MTVDLAEIARYMRMDRSVPDGALAERVAKLRDDALKAIRPAQTWRRFPIAEGAIASGGLRLEICGTLGRHLAGCRAACLACGTIGAEFDAFQRRVSVSSGVDALIVQAIGAALIEKLMDRLEDEIRANLAEGESPVSRYSPGYGDFPLAAQRVVLALLDAPRKVGVSLTDTLLMVPSKSVSAVIGITKG
ncbi:MAG: hypothetical protein IJH50_00030 [Kiritimatiellae bacterium]|nr:hypothetical protein [Kiritimatiellia bacterium]